jgi:hypothetical protein
MKSHLAAAGLLANLVAAPLAMAEDAAGHWIVSGRVAGLAFTSSCGFQQAGQNLGGVCVDGATSDPKVKGGRAHVLTRGRVNGDQVSWTYQSSFLLSHFNVDYSGVRRGDRMSGQIVVQGHTGTFTAERFHPPGESSGQVR